MSDYKLQKNERIDVEEVLKDLEHYRPRRRGWVWRTPASQEHLKEGPFQYRDISEPMAGDSVGLMTAHYFDNIDPQPMPTITTEIASGRFEDDIPLRRSDRGYAPGHGRRSHHPQAGPRPAQGSGHDRGRGGPPH